jgi:heme O synthase-like polyprenyltransferase
MNETEYLFSSENNKRRLLKSLKELEKKPSMIKEFIQILKSEIPWYSVIVFFVSMFCAVVFCWMIAVAVVGAVQR